MPRHALIPCLRYKDAPAAIEFLCNAFGFERHAVYADEKSPNVIHHAQLMLDGNMIMLGSTGKHSPAEDLYGWKTPQELGGITMCIYAVIDDPDAHAERAKAAGARIIKGPYDNDGYPGRAYGVRDTEGNVWNFGSYDPFAA
jgi:uncharacterized glyoxalase superfamily protein PhnB